MELWQAFMVGAGGAAAVKGLFDLIHWFLNRRAKKEDDAAAREREEEQQAKTDFGTLNRKIDVLFLADRTILYDRIKHLGKTYIARGYVTVEELEDLKRMHEVYHDSDKLNGNGFLDDLMNTVKTALEIRAK